MKRGRPWSRFKKNNFRFLQCIVNRAKWLVRPVNFQEANIQAEIYVGRYLTPPSACLLFYAYTVSIKYIIAMLLLVSCMSRRNHLLYFVRFCTRSTPKTANKNIQQRTFPNFARFPKHFLLLTRNVQCEGGINKVSFYLCWKFVSKTLMTPDS